MPSFTPSIFIPPSPSSTASALRPSSAASGNLFTTSATSSTSRARRPSTKHSTANSSSARALNSITLATTSARPRTSPPKTPPRPKSLAPSSTPSSRKPTPPFRHRILTFLPLCASAAAALPKLDATPGTKLAVENLCTGESTTLTLDAKAAADCALPQAGDVLFLKFSVQSAGG